MQLKVFGIVLIIAGSCSFGNMLCRRYTEEIKTLGQLLSVLEYMKCELSYKMTPLSQLCKVASGEATGELNQFLSELVLELDSQIQPDASHCVEAALLRCGRLPRISRDCLQELGSTLGRFDLTGQLTGIDSVHDRARRSLDALEKDKQMRIRSCRTLCLCAGAALAILLI